jgi:PAS domain S-box-containing protein
VETEAATILIIDDNADNLTAFRAVLTDTFPRATVLTAQEGLTGIEVALAQDPDVILLDLVMPVMDGFEVCTRLKADDRVRQIPVVIMTAAETDQAIRVRALECGAEAFLSKSIDGVELTAQVRAMTRIKASRRHQQQEGDRLAALVEERTRQLELELADRRKAEQDLQQANRHLTEVQTATLNILADLRQEIEVHRRTQALLEESETRYRTVADFTVDWETWLTPEATYAYVSPSCETITGHSADEFYCNPHLSLEIVLPEDQPEMESHWALVKGDQRLPCRKEYRIQTGQGQIRWIEHTCRSVYDRAGRYLGRRASNRDITDRKRTEEQLRELSRRHEAILREIPDIIMEVDTRKVYTWANPAGYAFFGEDVIGKEAACYFEGEQATYDQVEPLFCGQDQVFYVESWQRRRDGQRRLLAWWCQAVKDANGQTVGAISTARDVTDQRRMEESLRQSEARLRQAAEAGNVGLWDWDLNTNKAYYSLEWKRQIGYEDREIADDFSEWQSRVHPDDLGPCLETIRSFAENPRPGFETEFRFRHKDGSYRWIMARGSFVYDAQGKVSRMLGSHVDITERKEAEARLSQQLDELRRWQGVTLGRESRILELKREVNDLLISEGRAPRYASVTTADADADRPESVSVKEV